MRELYEQDYFTPSPSLTMQGLDLQGRKSSGTNGGTSTNTILGKFLKLGKSKSDVHGSNSSYVKRRQATTSVNNELEDDFVLAPVQLRGVEKMVHRAAFKKDNVSRSHSWIYGSVKLPSDLPFGYGYGASSSSNENSRSGTQSQTPSSDYSSTPPTHMHIPRCQRVDFGNCSCDCSVGNTPEEYTNFLTTSPNSVSTNKQSLPCQICRSSQQQIPNGNTNRKPNSQLPFHHHQPDSNKKFGNSVRKLTWKSLKQAVKKRPSLDSITSTTNVKGLGDGHGTTNTNNYTNYSSQDDFFNTSTTSYFFPEKKSNNFYASCTDLLVSSSQGPYVTASVRVRPKRSRGTWSFPNEFGPVSNYQEQEDGIYHSEWDLRQCMPYEQWLTTSSNSKNQSVNLGDLYESTVKSVRITNGLNRVNKPSSSEGKTSVSNMNSSSKARQSYPNTSDLYTNGGVKRFSILHNEPATAYQLNKGKEQVDNEDEESDNESNDDGSHLLLTDDPVRIAGQGIFMLTSTASNGHSSSSSKVIRSNSTSSNKYKTTNSPYVNKGKHLHHLLLSSSRSEADGVWSDTQITQEPTAIHKTSSASLQSNRDRNQIHHHDSRVENNGIIDQKVQLNTFKQPSQQAAHYTQSPLPSNDVSRSDGNGSKTKVPEPQIIKNGVGIGEKENVYTKNGNSLGSIIMKGNGLKGSVPNRSNGDSDNKYGALRRRRGRSSSTGGKNNLLRETIYEEEHENLDNQDESHAVKIVVSQTNGSDYVKPILKTRVSSGDDELSEHNLYDDTSSITLNQNLNRLPKKVQFNSTEEIVVCGGRGESESFDEDEDEEGDGSEDQTATDTAWISLNHDYGNDHVNPADDHCNETKSGSRNNLRTIKEPARKEVSITSTTTTLEESPKYQHETSVVKNQEETLQLSRTKFVKEKTLTNEVNNLQAISNQRNQNFTQNQEEMNIDGIKPSSFTSTKRKSETVQQTQNLHQITDDEKVILAKMKRTQNSKATIIKPERTLQNGDHPQLPGNEKESQLQKIINPNSLLFNDTTRIRLNQSRPSIENTFKFNGSGMTVGENGTPGSFNRNGSRKIRPSQSFRSNSATTGALRPKEPPPPPPPRVSSVQGPQVPKRPALDRLTLNSTNTSLPTTTTGSRTNKSQISLPIPMLGFSTTNDMVKESKVVTSYYQNGNTGNSNEKRKNKTLGDKCEAIEKVLSQQHQALVRNGTNSVQKPLRVDSHLTPRVEKQSNEVAQASLSNKSNESQNIEIVTKENSVSEIRIYSTIKSPEKPIPAPKNPDLVGKREAHYSSTSDLFQRPSVKYSQQQTRQQLTSVPASRPQSTSVVLIIDTSSSDATSNSIITNQKLRLSGSSQVLQPTDQIPSLIPPPLPPMNPKSRIEDSLVSSVGQHEMTTAERQMESQRDLIYDDVINHNNQLHHIRHSTPPIPKQKEEKPSRFLPPVNDFSPPTSPPPRPPSQTMTTTPVSNKLSSDVESLHSVYSDVGIGMTVSINNNQTNEMLLYDDTLSLISSNYETNGTGDIKSPVKPMIINQNSSDESTDTLVEEEPLYDDVLNVIKTNYQSTGDSDSGTETDVPPPLPSSGPPLHLLPEISLEIPLIPLPVLPGLIKSSKGSISKGTNRLLGEIIGFSKKISGRSSGIDSNKEEPNDLGEKNREEGTHPLNHSKISDPIVSNRVIGNVTSGENILKTRPMFLLDVPEEDPNSSSVSSNDTLDRTRSLLIELNEKLANLNFSPQDYSTYISKVLISSSSESSGVEEDYNSEKNYSLSNDDGSGASSASVDENYKLTKLVSETISMARGKFLDSMKISNNNNNNNNNNGSSGGNGNGPSSVRITSTGSDTEEPIYEEINDNNNSADVPKVTVSNGVRSTSPIYADAFDAKSIFDGASRSEILSFLESIRDRLTVSDSNSGGNRQTSVGNPKKYRKSTEIERNDSGIGSESGSIVTLTNKNTSTTTLRTLAVCKDCNDSSVDLRSSGEGENQLFTHLCRPCSRKRNERKEIVQEIYETELKYGRDLRIISDEFYTPIQTAGLLTKDQLDQIFLNVPQLIEINIQLSSSLKSAISEAIGLNGGSASSDEDLNSVNVGRIFLEIGEKMMNVFESYCTRQANAGALLTQLEKEKELLRIFLRVSQMENAVLRRMNLPAFLMVPVQRVTRYPLLLSRLLKVTALDHPTRDELQLAHEKIEQNLEHMNKTAREVASVKLWRRISIINGNMSGNGNSVSSTSPVNRRPSTDFDGASVRIRKMALDILDWTSFKDVSFVIESHLNIVQCSGGKTLRNIYGLLLARGQNLEDLALRMDQDIFFPPRDDVVKDVKLVLVRVKNTRFSLLREPLCLGKCVISRSEIEFQDSIEINEISTKNTYYLQGMDRDGTSLWLKLLQCHSICVGQWRRRRGALANIMMNGMMRHL